MSEAGAGADPVAPVAGAWRQVPGPTGSTRTGADRPVAVGALVVLWVGVAGPVVRAAGLPASRPSYVAAVGVAATAGLVLARRAPWFVRLAVAAAAAGLLYSSQGQILTAWMPVGLLLGTWVAFDAPPLPLLPRPAEGSLAPVLVLAGVALWQGSDPAATWQPFPPLALAGAMPLVLRFGGGAIDRLVAGVGRVVGAAVSAVTFAVLGALLLLVPWAYHRIIGLDPLAAPQGWAERDRRPLRPRHLWAADPTSVALPGAVRVRRLAVVGLAAAVLAVTVGQPALDRLRPAREGGTLDLGASREAGGGEPWARELSRDMAWVLDTRVALRPFEVYRLHDVETRYVNVHHGHRDSWTAPRCSCRRVQLWLYGGATVFGVGQRDDHTIASELARVARRDGIVLDVVNRGLPMEQHERNALRFAWDLTYAKAPDLAVFLDGADDVASALALAERGLGDTRAPYDAYAEGLFDDLFADAPVHDSNGLVQDLGWPTASDLGSDDPGRLAAVRFARFRGLSQDTSATSGVPVRYFWQPSSYARGSLEAEVTRSLDDDELARRRQAWSQARRYLPDDVVDLTQVFDGVPGSVFVDETDLDERGARIVAEALYRELRPELRRFARGAG